MIELETWPIVQARFPTVHSEPRDQTGENLPTPYVILQLNRPGIVSNQNCRCQHKSLIGSVVKIALTGYRLSGNFGMANYLPATV